MSTSLYGLEGKHAIVLGGGYGMGEATANLLADVGCNVAVMDILPDRAERVAADLAKKGVKSLPIVGDVTVDDQLIAALERAEKELGPLSRMATIVGMAHMESSIDVSMDLWDLDHRRNLRYVFLAARELARRLIARGEPGAIASVASVDGIRASQHHASYGAAKAGLISLAKSLSGEWAQEGVRMNIVAPGGIVTPRAKLRAPEVEFEQMKLVPMQKRGTIFDIASALVFLLSEQAVYITGQTIAVDGGLTGVGPIDYSYLSKMKGATGVVKDPLDV